MGTGSAGAHTTQTIPEPQWEAFLEAFTRENRGSRARLSVIGADEGAQVETGGRLLDGVSADFKDGERTIWITFGSTPAEHLAHAVDQAAVLRVLLADGGLGPVLEVETEDGAKTLLEIAPLGGSLLPEGSRGSSQVNR